MAEKMDMQHMMEIYQKLATPGEPHKLLEEMVGIWDSKGMCYSEGKSSIERGVMEQHMILGGRFLEQDYKGTAMGMPFEGVGLVGYDNSEQKYVSTWIDTMSTGIMTFDGLSGPDGQSIIQHGLWNDPVRGSMTFRSVYTIISSNQHRFEMYCSEKGGKEEKMIENIYTRRS